MVKTRLAWEALIGSVTAFAAAAMNSIAGGRTFIALPTLVNVIEMTKKTANATYTVGLRPGYVATIGIRGDAGGRVDAAEDAASDNRGGGGAHDRLWVAGVPMKEQRS